MSKTLTFGFAVVRLTVVFVLILVAFMSGSSSTAANCRLALREAFITAIRSTAGRVYSELEEVRLQGQQFLYRTADITANTLWTLEQRALDASITAAVTTKLMNDEMLSDDSIDVQTESGVVVLRGSVATREGVARASRLAGEVHGVQSVLPRLYVRNEA